MHQQPLDRVVHWQPPEFTFGVPSSQLEETVVFCRRDVEDLAEESADAASVVGRKYADLDELCHCKKLVHLCFIPPEVEAHSTGLWQQIWASATTSTLSFC